MDEKSFNPHVRFITRRVIKVSYPNSVLAYDHRLFYALKGSFAVEVASRRIAMEAGGMAVLPPGMPYRLTVEEGTAEIYIVNFDFDSDRIDDTVKAPVAEDAFIQADIFSKQAIPPFDTIFSLVGAYTLEPLLEEMIGAKELEMPTRRQVQSGLMKCLLAKASYLAAKPHRSVRDPLIQSIKEYVNANYAKPINNSTLATEMGYHPYYLGTCFFKSEGITLHAYIESVRLAHAKEMLMRSEIPISEIAQACGFAEASYFVKFFRRHTGMTPKIYRGFGM